MKYKSVTTIKEIKEYLGSAKVVAFDFETSPLDKYRDEDKAALDPHKAIIVGVSFSAAEGTAIYVPISHRTGENVKEPKELMVYLKTAVFQNPKVIKVAHNLSFEAMFLYAKGIVVQPPVYDTIAAAQLTLKSKWEYRSLSDSGLKLLAASLFGAEMPDFQTVTNGRHFDELDPQNEETIHYACADADYTLRLYHRFNGWFDCYLSRHRFIVENIESPTAVYVGMMKYNGLLVDKDLMLAKQAEAEKKLKNLRSEINAMTGGVNIGANASTSAFKKYLYNDLGLPVLKTTEKYQEAADDQALILLRDWCYENKPELVQLFNLVQEYRKWGKLKSTYIDGYLEHINSATGRIHPDMFPLGTETGRFASRNPNCQNIPRPDSDAIGVRNFFLAPAGKVILSLDLSQIELRVGAFFCRDEKMLETYRSGGDIHAQTTSVIYRIPFSQARDKNAKQYKERRVIAKNCNFGVFYGLFPRGLQRTLKFKAGLNTPLSECAKIITNLKAGYPGLSHWQGEVKAHAANTCFAETWLGRRRYLIGMLSEDWGKHSFAERCALNTPIQGTAADILKLAIGRIVEGLSKRLWLKPLLQVHDELNFELPVDKLQEAVNFIKTCMEAQPFPEFDVPIIAEAAVGTRFGSLKEMEV
ncbi:bifunctional 3'-5' exonuclease/DNA polymerase [Pelotomaculum propionicicum]|uniref:bifunctional 3'-5' exonuclease/DNA polymerase n=1 Tax=Pelotomaculum propionicicum TaxID=258475 RepID=UPI003B79B72A